jgi:hypothetical protein
VIDHVIEVTILATIEREQRRVEEATLVRGNYKLLGTWVEKLAGRPQSFTITVSPRWAPWNSGPITRA